MPDSPKISATDMKRALLLAGKVAVVTGSTSGIGLGIAAAFAREGANVVINGFGDEVEIERARQGLESHALRRSIPMPI